MIFKLGIAAAVLIAAYLLWRRYRAPSNTAPAAVSSGAVPTHVRTGAHRKSTRGADASGTIIELKVDKT